MNLNKQIFIFIGAMLFSSCGTEIKVNLLKNGGKGKNKVEIIVENTKSATYKGWWIYGEKQHIFKDEQTLDEYYLEFLNENMEELQALYLAVCEMEYFPMECTMTGRLKKSVLEKKTILIVTNFEILYVQGCGE